MLSIERRKFLTTAAALTAGVATQAMSLSTSNDQKQLVHHVFFWLKDPVSVEDRDKLVEGLRTLAAIKSIRSLHIGIPAATEKRDVVDASWQVSELMFFDNAADQKTYQDHPVHQAFITNYSHLWKKVLVYDMNEL